MLTLLIRPGGRKHNEVRPIINVCYQRIPSSRSENQDKVGMQIVTNPEIYVQSFCRQKLPISPN